MKKTLSVLLVALLLVGTLFTLASCGGDTLSGKYESNGLFGNTTYEFDGDKVAITHSMGINIVINGTYEITEDENGNDIIIFTIPAGQEGAESFSGKHSFAKGEENGVKYIKIDGTQYYFVE